MERDDGLKMEKLFRWIDANKERDTWWINLLKFLYSVGRIKPLHSIFNAVFAIVIPLFFTYDETVLGIIMIFVLIADIIFDYVCSNYRNKKYIQRKFASEILSNQSSLINSMIIEVQNNAQWRMTVFKKISDLVCEKIHNVFKEILRCETRVSIEYVLSKEKNGKKEKFVKMAGRRSPNRDTCRASVSLEQKKKYYSYQIFTQHEQGITILSYDEISNDQIWYKNKAHDVDVKQYFGIAVSVQNKGIDFILQIDCLDDINIGNNTDVEITSFINRYLKAYINIVSFAYLMNLNKKKEIPEV